MIWLTWRQFRAQALSVLAVAGALAVVLLVTAPHLASMSDEWGTGFLDRLVSERLDRWLYYAALALYVLPPAIGAFWGAPLIARELETGTHRVAWNQSVTRWRWLSVKVALVGLAAIGVSALLSLAVTWWASPIDQASARERGPDPFALSRMDPLVFGARGIVPIAYTALAFAIGVAAGLVLRRTVPAMVATLVLVVAVQFAVPMFARAHLRPATEYTTAITGDNLAGMLISGGGPGRPSGPVEEVLVKVEQPGAWILANQPVNRAGQVQSKLPTWVSDCVPADVPQFDAVRRQACFQRLAAEGYHQVIRYQPASRFWPLQALESALLLALAALVTGFAFVRARRVF